MRKKHTGARGFRAQCCTCTRVHRSLAREYAKRLQTVRDQVVVSHSKIAVPPSYLCFESHGRVLQLAHSASQRTASGAGRRRESARALPMRSCGAKPRRALRLDDRSEPRDALLRQPHCRWTVPDLACRLRHFLHMGPWKNKSMQRTRFTARCICGGSRGRSL